LSSRPWFRLSSSCSRRDEVGFVEQEEIGHRDLLARGFGFLHLLLDLLGIDHGDDRVDAHELLKLRDVQEGLRDRAGIGDAGGLDEQVIEAARLMSCLHAFDEILAHGAAEAAVAELEHFVVGLFDERAVDADLADFIDDDGEFVAVLLLEDVVEQRGFPGAEEAGEDGDGDGFHGSWQVRAVKRIGNPQKSKLAAGVRLRAARKCSKWNGRYFVFFSSGRPVLVFSETS
jgi:hypothetical protein